MFCWLTRSSCVGFNTQESVLVAAGVIRKKGRFSQMSNVNGR